MIGLPFSAFVGQDDARLALTLCLIDPGIGGCLLMGPSGTGKSALARSVVRLNRAAPFITVPLGVSESRLVGDTGLVCLARGGILFIDDVNLLSRSCSSLLLGLGATGSAPGCQLLATVNPEEGRLGPQLLDRFGLSVALSGLRAPADRALVARRVIGLERDPAAFYHGFGAQDEALAEAIRVARGRLSSMELSAGLRELAARLANDAGTGGSRGELALARSAVALAAYRGRDHVRVEDVETVAPFALGHRRRDAPGAGSQHRNEEWHAKRSQNDEYHRNDERPWSGEPRESADRRDTEDPSRGERRQPERQARERPSPRRSEALATLSKTLSLDESGRDRGGTASGRRGLRLGLGTRGRHVRPVRPDAYGKGATKGCLALEASIRAALRRRPGEPVCLEPEDARFWLNARRTGGETLFVVDASGSMGARRRMSFVKAALAGLLDASYRARDEVAVIVFRGEGAELVVPRTRSLALARARLDALEAGGATPLAAGLSLSGEYLERRRTEAVAKGPVPAPTVVIVTDGRAKDTDTAEALALSDRLARLPARYVVVDCESGWARSGGAGRLAASLGAKHVLMENYV